MTNGPDIVYRDVKDICRLFPQKTSLHAAFC